MSYSLLLWLAVMVGLLAVNAFFVAIEFALVALRPSRVQELVDSGSSTARTIQKLQQNMGTSVSGAQLGITFASLALGWVCEPSIHELITSLIGLIPGMDGVQAPAGIAMAISLLTLSALHVVIGEQVPKCWALRLAEPVGMLLARPFALYCRIAWPLIKVLDGITNGILRLAGISKVTEHEQTAHSAEELEILFDHSVKGGELDPRSTEMLKGVLDLSELTAEQVMLPRDRVDCIDRKMSLLQAVGVASKTKHSRLPVIDGSKDQVVGVLHVKDLFDVLHGAMQSGANGTIVMMPNARFDLLIRKIHRIARTDKAIDVLEAMRKRDVQIAIVQDEQQKTVGMVTMEDILEWLVGEINDEHDRPAARNSDQKSGPPKAP